MRFTKPLYTIKGYRTSKSVPLANPPLTIRGEIVRGGYIEPEAFYYFDNGNALTDANVADPVSEINAEVIMADSYVIVFKGQRRGRTAL